MKFPALSLALLAAAIPSAWANDETCALPDNADQFSLVTLEDASDGAHSHYKGIAVGGTFVDTTNESGTVDKTKSYINEKQGSLSLNFNGGVQYGATDVPASMWPRFEYLAQHAKSSQEGDHKVVVVNKGGTYNLYDFNNGGQGYDRGKTLVIFNTSEDIYLTKTSDSRQFGPSVIAPFAKVILKGDAGFIDGSVYAKQFETSGGNQGQLQMHGETYSGVIKCGDADEPTATTTAATTGAPPTTTTTTAAPPTGGGGDCNVFINNQSPWHAGVMVGFDSDTYVLDFTNSGLDLTTVNFSAGQFTGEVIGQTVKLTKPAYITSTNPGGFQLSPKQGPNEALGTFTEPECGERVEVTTTTTTTTTEAPPTTTVPPPTTTVAPPTTTVAPPTTTEAPPTTDEPMTTGSPPGAKGDPHFKTHGGEMYDFHGGCDLVLLENPDFMDGMGMLLHIRTKIEAWWSFIQGAALLIGEETLEIKGGESSDQWLYVNGAVNEPLEKNKWNVVKFAGLVLRFKQSNLIREAHVYLGNGKKISMKSFNGFVKVDVDAEGSDLYNGSNGLLGRFPDGKRVARDGESLIEDINAFGQHWQVQPEEPMLFHSYTDEWVVPAGNKCAMPVDTLEKTQLRNRRLGSGLSNKAVEDACAHLKVPDERKACEYDVVSTQDVTMASVW